MEEQPSPPAIVVEDVERQNQAEHYSIASDEDAVVSVASSGTSMRERQLRIATKARELRRKKAEHEQRQALALAQQKAAEIDILREEQELEEAKRLKLNSPSLRLPKHRGAREDPRILESGLGPKH